MESSVNLRKKALMVGVNAIKCVAIKIERKKRKKEFVNIKYAESDFNFLCFLAFLLLQYYLA